jgi:hypothetical protein
VILSGFSEAEMIKAENDKETVPEKPLMLVKAMVDDP